MQVEAIVIGAGAAGLAAAEKLSAARIKTLVLEARERVGGRVFTMRDKGFPVELGAEFVHGKTPQIFEIAARENFDLKPVGGASWQIDQNGELVPTSTAENTSEAEIWQKLNEFSGADISFADFLQKYFAAPEYSAARESAARYVEGFHAARLSEISTLGLKLTENETGEDNYRFQAGYDQIIQNLYERAAKNGAEFRLREIVKTINWRKKSVVIETVNAQETFVARAAVFTLPLGVWQRGAIGFAPDLPTEKLAALAKMKMGAALRVAFRFKRKWWLDFLRQKGESSLGFLFSRDAEIPVWWTSEPNEANVLTGWAGGARAEKLNERGTDSIVATAIEALARIFKTEKSFVEKEIDNVFTYDWQADEFALGSYSYILKNGLDAPKILAQSVENTLFFAGEATNYGGHWATVHGALETGQRAAQEIIETFSLKP